MYKIINVDPKYLILAFDKNSPTRIIDNESNTVILKHPKEIDKQITNDDIIEKIPSINQIYGGVLITLFNHKNAWYSIILLICLKNLNRL
jgi:hypothetical protein